MPIALAMLTSVGSKGSFSVSQDLKMVSGRAASKGPFEGVLLSAVALVNQLIFLLAVCVCESENTDNWTWFLGCLKEVLADARQLTFMTDKHKGILNAINLEFYGSQNRCVKIAAFYGYVFNKNSFYIFFLQLCRALFYSVGDGLMFTKV